MASAARRSSAVTLEAPLGLSRHPEAVLDEVVLELSFDAPSCPVPPRPPSTKGASIKASILAWLEQQL